MVEYCNRCGVLKLWWDVDIPSFGRDQQFKKASRADANQPKARESQPVTIQNWDLGRSLCDGDKSATSAMQDGGVHVRISIQLKIIFRI